MKFSSSQPWMSDQIDADPNDAPMVTGPDSLARAVPNDLTM
jgi:hypothetical protein